MDSFTTLSLSASTPVQVPKDAEGNNGQGSGTYCVVFAKDIPTDAEGNNGQGSGYGGHRGCLEWSTAFTAVHVTGILHYRTPLYHPSIVAFTSQTLMPQISYNSEPVRAAASS